MTSQYLLVNHYPVMEGKEKEIQDLAEKNSKALPEVSSFYISQDEGELIEFISLSSLNELAKYENNLASAFTEVVRNNSTTIESFDAYHSLISQIPGVMFISCFNGSVETYLKPFTDDNYKNIVTQAGDSYITGGNEGLYTKIYKKLGM